MTISNSTDFNLTRDQIITTALIDIGVYRPGATVSAADIAYCSIKLNAMVKAWEGQGIHMWKATEGTLFLRTGVNQYSISSSSSDQAGDNTIETTLSAAASNTTLTLTSTTGMTAADNIGIALDAGTRQWTTIVSVDSATQVTITTALTSVASSGNTVFTYTTHSSKPLHISGARFRNSDGTDRPIYIRGREEFMLIPNKTITGKVNQMFYNPNITDATIYVWPTPDIVADRLKFSYIQLIDDFDSSGDNADLPTEWLDALIINLSYKVAQTYGKSKDIIANLKQDAHESLAQMQLWDTSNGSTKVCLNYRDED